MTNCGRDDAIAKGIAARGKCAKEVCYAESCDSHDIHGGFSVKRVLVREHSHFQSFVLHASRAALHTGFLAFFKRA